MKSPVSYTHLVIAGMKFNLTKSSLDGFLAMAKRYDVELRINLLKPVQKAHFALLPSVEQVYDAFDYLTNNTDFVSLSEPVIAAQMGVPTNGCPCGVSSFRIRSKINNRVPVTPCVYLDLEDVYKRQEQTQSVSMSGCCRRSACETACFA